MRHNKLLQQASTFFDLGKVSSIFKAGGYANVNYCVETDSGSYIFKFNLEHPEADILEEIQYLERLRQYNFPSPYYLANKVGKFVCKQGNFVITVQPRIEGNKPKPSLHTARQIAKALAQLHRIPTKDLPFKKHWLQPEYLPGAVRIAKEQLPKIDVSGFLYEYEQIKDIDFRSLPQSITHGDVHPDNCLYTNGLLTAILDWEEVGIGISLLDLARAILGFCFEDYTKPELILAMINEYENVRDLTPEEKISLPKAVRYTGLALSIWLLLQFNLYRPDENLKDEYKFYWDKGLGRLSNKVLFRSKQTKSL